MPKSQGGGGCPLVAQQHYWQLSHNIVIGWGVGKGVGKAGVAQLCSFLSSPPILRLTFSPSGAFKGFLSLSSTDPEHMLLSA